jgi:hypothetical protein
MTDEKDRRIRELESKVKALRVLVTALDAHETDRGQEPTDATVVHLREMVAEARGRASAEALVTSARRDLRQFVEARNRIDRGAQALCLAAHALVLYELQRQDN